jgi:hypothetical protein
LGDPLLGRENIGVFRAAIETAEIRMKTAAAKRHASCYEFF